jgi:hypothetical protein
LLSGLSLDKTFFTPATQFDGNVMDDGRTDSADTL